MKNRTAFGLISQADEVELAGLECRMHAFHYSLGAFWNVKALLAKDRWKTLVACMKRHMKAKAMPKTWSEDGGLEIVRYVDTEEFSKLEGTQEYRQVQMIAAYVYVTYLSFMDQMATAIEFDNPVVN